jgi:peptidoglycan hydrolase-like protein with peptidoglycan-binding domain
VTRRKEEAELIEHGDYRMGDAVAEPMADGMLIKGERGTEVADLQKRLADLALYTGRIDGIFGFGTEKAVLDFLRAHGLMADGYAGPLTLEALMLKPPIPDVDHYPEPAPKPAEPVKRPQVSTAAPTSKPPPWLIAILIIALIVGASAALFFS